MEKVAPYVVGKVERLGGGGEGVVSMRATHGEHDFNAVILTVDDTCTHIPTTVANRIAVAC